jgi:hypothetical protein
MRGRRRRYMRHHSKRLFLLLAALTATFMLMAWSPHALSQAPRAANDLGHTFLPLLLASLPTSTPTPTATPTPTSTPTPPACPLDDVTGSYLMETSNLEHNCPGGTVEPPPPATIEITQDGTALTLSSETGDATGTIDPHTGDFEVVVTIDAAPGLCPFGCQNTTTGTFLLGHEPMTFAGSGQLDIKGLLGGTLCSVTYDLDGTRTDCTASSTPFHPCAVAGGVPSNSRYLPLTSNLGGSPR